jgi:hypothetical protein
MNLEKVVFGFFIVLAATLNFGFVIGEIDNPMHHHIYELFAAIVVNLIATVLKFGDRTQIGAVHLSTSLVADLQLVAAACVWAIAFPRHRRGNVARDHDQRRLAERRRAPGEHRFSGPADCGNRDVAALTGAAA